MGKGEGCLIVLEGGFFLLLFPRKKIKRFFFRKMQSLPITNLVLFLSLTPFFPLPYKTL